MHYKKALLVGLAMCSICIHSLSINKLKHNPQKRYPATIFNSTLHIFLSNYILFYFWNNTKVYTSITKTLMLLEFCLPIVLYWYIFFFSSNWPLNWYLPTSFYRAKRRGVCFYTMSPRLLEGIFYITTCLKKGTLN